MKSFTNCKTLLKCLSICMLMTMALSSCAKPAPKTTLDTRLQMRLSGTSHPADGHDTAAAEAKNNPSEAALAEISGFTPVKPVPDVRQPATKSLHTGLRFDGAPSITVAADKLPLHDFVHHVFGDLLRVNYVLSSKVPETENVSLSLDEKVSPGKLFDLATGLLNGFNVKVTEKEGIFFIAPMPDQDIPTIGWGATPADIPSVPGTIRQIAPLRYVDAQVMVNMMGRIPGIQANAVVGENAMSVIGTRDGVAQVMQYVAIFDQPAMRGKFGAMIRLKYWTPGELTPKLRDILTIEGLPISDNPAQGGVKLISIDRWRLLVVFAAEKHWMDRVRYWIDLLDVPEDSDTRRYFIYFPENSRASELLETIQTILEFTPGAPAQTGPSSQGTGGAERTEGTSGSRTTGPFTSAPARAAAASEKKEQIGISAVRPGLAVDETRNALIIYTDPAQYHAIETLLKQLDIMPPQILIEATVAEITLVDNLQYGLEWYLKNTDGSQTSIISTQGGLGLGSAGLNLSMVADSDKFRLLVSALAEEELVQVLSSPRLTVRDGKTASINVGTQVPVVTSETASADAGTNDRAGVVRTYQYRTTGISLNVTPTVHAQDVVTLEISQEVSEPSASGGENPLILNRTVSTEVVAASGQTLVIGGLIKENKGVKKSKVPFFGDLPLLGHLFEHTNKGEERTELVVMITPHIIRSSLEIDDIRRKMFNSFLHLEWAEE